MESKIKIGDTIVLGTYPQGKNEEIEPIEWQVLDIKDNKALLISRYGLDAQPFNKEYISTSWETCTLRKWLNHDFYNKAFSAIEQERIQTTLVTADKNPDWHSHQGHDTQDKIFLLSIKEVNKYFKNDDERMAKRTDYCYKQGAWKDFSGNCHWRLRSSGYVENYAAYVDSDGSVLSRGNFVHKSYEAVRPALIIEL